ncbi:MAG TPA: type II toxin-antitoxin system HicB family antitoxin [Longimicrobium sp.]|jgi:predicted RNase H-like HicB family nuclease
MEQYSPAVQWSDEDDAYIAVCPDLGGISAFGDTPAEALAELEVAVRLAVEAYQEKGWPLPPRFEWKVAPGNMLDTPSTRTGE